MYRSIAAVLVFLAAWTLTTNIVTLLGGTLTGLMLWSPVAVIALVAIFRALPSRTLAPTPSSCISDASSERHTAVFVGIALLVTALLRFNWTAFWLASVTLLATHVVIAARTRGPEPSIAIRTRTTDRWVILLTMAVAAVLALAANRPDADDAFYVGVAAFTHAHPHAPLLAVDPMYGEPGWPLLLPSYRWASYEILAAALARIFGIPAMDVMYGVLPPLGAAFVVASAFFLGRQLLPRHWLLMGLATVALGLVLGESHRSLGNFMFVRIFQGKSIYASALMPLIFALTLRCASQEGTSRDVMLLACAQLAAIGISNFGMLAAPMAGGTALAACVLMAPRDRYARLAAAACTLLIPLPYLLYVVMASRGAGQIPGADESAQAVWLAVFGQRQQYLVALLLLVAPGLAPDPRVRAWLAVPSLILFGVLLNPWLAGFISHYITSAPVYWRVTWCFPVVAYMAWGICIIARQVRAAPMPLLLGTITACLLVWSVPLGVLRADNGVSWRLAGPQAPAADYDAARLAITQTSEDARLLAGEPVSSVAARFERHPRLVLVRDMYLPILRSGIDETAFSDRLTLQNFINGAFQEQDSSAISDALSRLDVETVVTTAGETPTNHLLGADGYASTETLGPYEIWRRKATPPR